MDTGSLKMNAPPPVVREYVFGDYRIDLANYQLWHGDHPVTLAPKVFDILAVLIQHRDRAVSKDELLSSVWLGASVTEDSLTNNISVLRKALGDDTTHPTLIATIARRGYRFIAPVVEHPVNRPAADAEPKNSRLALLAGVAVLAMAIGSALPLVFSSRQQTHEEPRLRFSISAPEGTRLISGGILSPNGRYMLLLAEDDRSNSEQIWIRTLDSLHFRPIPGTEGASRPFWSPDSRLIGFFAEGSSSGSDSTIRPRKSSPPPPPALPEPTGAQRA